MSNHVQRFLRPEVFEPTNLKANLPTKIGKLAARGELDALRLHLEKNPKDLNRHGAMGRTLVWEAARMGRLETVEYLVAIGADINLTGCYNAESMLQLTPHCAARFYQREDVERYLSSLKPNIDLFRAAFLGDSSRVLAENPSALNSEDPLDKTYFSPVIAFAVLGRHIALIQELLNRRVEIAPYSDLLVRICGIIDDIAILRMLIDAGLEVRSARSAFGATNNMEMLKVLLDQGAPTDILVNDKLPLLCHMCRGDKGDHPEKVELLLKRHVDVNVRGPGGRTPLHYAASGGLPKTISLLLAAGANPKLRDDDGRTPYAVAKPTIAALLR